MRIQELPPNIFVFGNYGADIPFGVYTGKGTLYKYLKEQEIIGYCKCPEFKPLKDYAALLLRAEDGGEYWSHIPDYVLEKLLKS